MAKTERDDAAESSKATEPQAEVEIVKPSAEEIETAEVTEPTEVPAAEAAEVAEEEVAAPEELQAEIERLRAENASLSSAAAPHTFWRNASAGVLILIGVVLVALSISALWLNRTIMDEDRFVQTFAPLAKNVAIQDWVAKSSTDAIFANVDIEGYVKQALAQLPEQAQVLATPITGAIQNFITESATKVVRSPQFATVFEKTLRVTHKAFIVAITDKSTGVVTKQGGTVTLDVNLLVDQIKAALADKGLGFVQNINLPVSTSQITLVDSQAVADLGTAISIMNASALILPLLALVLLGGGIALAANRRKAVLWMGVGILTLTIIPVQAIYLGAVPFGRTMLDLAAMPSAASQAAYDIIFVNLVRANQLASVVGLVFLVSAIIAGPSSWATALRNGLSHGLTNIGPDWDFGVAGEWIHTHESGMRTTGIILGVIVLLVSPAKSIGTIIWAIVVVVLWIAAVTFFGRPRPQRPAIEPNEDETVAAEG